jgi:hypothetical protein
MLSGNLADELKEFSTYNENNFEYQHPFNQLEEFAGQDDYLFVEASARSALKRELRPFISADNQEISFENDCPTSYAEDINPDLKFDRSDINSVN